MITKFKYSATDNSKAKVRNVVILTLNSEKIMGIDLDYLTKDEAKICKNIISQPNSALTEETKKVIAPFMKAFRSFKINKVIK